MSHYSNIQLVAYHVPTSTVSPTGALTSAPTVNEVQHLTNADAKVRIQRLWDVAQYARRTGNLAGPDTLKIFMAPEFYFRSGINGYADIQTVSSMYAALLSAFSTPDFESWLIIPGSIFCHQAAPPPHHIAFFNMACAIRGGAAIPLSSEDRHSAIPIYASGMMNQKSLTSRVDYSYDPSTGVKVDRRDWDGAVNPYFHPTIADWAGQKSHIFQIKGINDSSDKPITFGLEVSLEHSGPDETQKIGMLQRTLADWPARERSAPPPVIDVHLVLSCGTGLVDGHVCARKGGYALLCDGLAAPRSGETTSSLAKVIRQGNLDKNVGAPMGVGLPQNLHLPLEPSAQKLAIYPAVLLS